MDTGFKNSLKSDKEKKHSIDVKSLPYDQRSSCFVNVGSKHGVGHRQPIGTISHSNKNAVPQGRVKTLRVDEKD